MSEELEKELAFKTMELNLIKEVLAVFLDKVYTEVDNITPEDLELWLRQTEQERYLRVIEMLPLSVSSVDEASIWLNEIEQLCETLGWVKFTGFSPSQNIRFFIKDLARQNHRLTLELKMISDKQTNVDSRINNLDSSNTSTS